MDLENPVLSPKLQPCGACGAPLRIGAKFCVNCGMPRASVAGSRHRPESPPASEDIFVKPDAVNEDTGRCPNCGKVAEPGPATHFCRACGHGLAAETGYFSGAGTAAGQWGNPRLTGRARAPTISAEVQSRGRADNSGTRLNRTALGFVMLGLTCAGAGAGYWLANTRAPSAELRVEAAAMPSHEPATQNAQAGLPQPADLEEHTPLATVLQEPPPPIIEPPSRRVESGAEPRRPPARPSTPPTRLTQVPAAVTTAKAADPPVRGPVEAVDEPVAQVARSADPSPPQQTAENPPRGRTSVQVESVVQGARTIDELFQQRAAVECRRGPIGFICREKIRMGLCDRKWSETAVRGMKTCHVLARAGPPD